MSKELTFKSLLSCPGGKVRFQNNDGGTIIPIHLLYPGIELNDTSWIAFQVIYITNKLTKTSMKIHQYENKKHLAKKYRADD